MIIINKEVQDQKQRLLWSLARESGENLSAALADGDRVLAKLYAGDVIDYLNLLDKNKNTKDKVEVKHES